MLYMINSATISSNNLESLMLIAPKDSPVLFYEDGVYACKDKTRISEKVRELIKNHPTFALTEDVKARGIQALIEEIKQINYDGFVELVESHNVVPWFRN